LSEALTLITFSELGWSNRWVKRSHLYFWYLGRGFRSCGWI